MENGTGWICRGEGRVGAWYAYNDGFGLQSPPPQTPGVPILPVVIPNEREGSARAMYSRHVYPSPDVPEGAWGAGIGVDLAFDGSSYGLYDASTYDGITFFARSSMMHKVQIRVDTAETTLVEYGGTCPEEFCNPHCGEIVVRPDWDRYSLPFADLIPHTPYGFIPGPFRSDQLTNVQFLFIEHAYHGEVDADLWVDDLAFFTGSPPSEPPIPGCSR